VIPNRPKIHVRGNKPIIRPMGLANALRILPALFLVLLLAACAPVATTPGTVRVSRVIDGDTIVISTGQHVRYIGMDTPEMSPLEAFAQEATDVNRDMVEGKTVRLEKDTSETDRYGRLLRYVWVGDTMVNIELVLKGLAEAKAYPPDTRYQRQLDAAEDEARAAGLGMWGR
jgi:endonuclease YncB( thermonuclease family)